MFTANLKKAIADTLFYGLNEDTDNPTYLCYKDPVQQGLETPGFFIETITSNITKLIGKRAHERTLFNVIYYPQDTEEYLSEFDELTGKLYPLLQMVEDRDSGECYHTQDLEITPTTGQLNIQFAIEYDVLYGNTGDVMERMEYERR